jgi:hypothetical protein
MGGEVVVDGVFAAGAVGIDVVGVPLRSLHSASADMATAGGLLENDSASRSTQCPSFVAGYVALDVFVVAFATKFPETASEPVRSAWFKWHKFSDGTTAAFPLRVRIFLGAAACGPRAGLRQSGMGSFSLTPR